MKQIRIFFAAQCTITSIFSFGMLSVATMVIILTFWWLYLETNAHTLHHSLACSQNGHFLNFLPRLIREEEEEKKYSQATQQANARDPEQQREKEKDEVIEEQSKDEGHKRSKLFNFISILISGLAARME